MEWSVSALRRLFSKQIQILRARGCPQLAIRELEEQRTSVILEASQMDIAKGNIPFLPVVLPNLPITMWSIGSVAALIHYRGGTCVSHLSPQRITDLVEIPQKCYFIFDVEDGTATLFQSPRAAEIFIKEQNRSCLTVAETIALAALTNVLSYHQLDATGSQYNSPAQVPHIAAGGLAVLNWRIASEPYDQWGSPSCRKRMCFLQEKDVRSA